MTKNIYLRFPDWKPKALTLSYDDATKTDIRLIDVMRQNGLKGTFNINSGLYSYNVNRLSESEAFEVYSQSGMEIAAHGLKHSSADCLSDVELINEFKTDKENLEATYGNKVCGFAYANGVATNNAISVLEKVGFSYARTVTPTNNFCVPAGDWFRWNPTCHHSAQNFESLTQTFINTKFEQFDEKDAMLFYVWGHSIEFERDNNWDLIENFAKRVRDCDDIWNATNIEVCDYIKAYNGLVFDTERNAVLNNTVTDVHLLIEGKKVLAKAKENTEF